MKGHGSGRLYSGLRLMRYFVVDRPDCQNVSQSCSVGSLDRGMMGLLRLESHPGQPALELLALLDLWIDLDLFSFLVKDLELDLSEREAVSDCEDCPSSDLLIWCDWDQFSCDGGHTTPERFPLHQIWTFGGNWWWSARSGERNRHSTGRYRGKQAYKNRGRRGAI